MDDLTQQVSHNLKRIRDQRKISLDKLAELTGVSKSMLGQIERGESSPTISVVWKIASGLKLSFTALLDSPRAEIQTVAKSAIQPLIENDGKYRLFPLFPFDERQSFEIYMIEIDPQGYIHAEPHSNGVEEFITVFSGELTVIVNGRENKVPSGDSIHFRADVEHGYRNDGNMMTVLHMVISYPSK